MKESIEKKLVEKRIYNLDSREVAAVATIEAMVSKGFFKYCFNQGWLLIDPPPITAATGACENFLTVFDVDFFGKPGYLSQTGQLYLEAFLSNPQFQGVFCSGPSFRKEPVVDNRHCVAFTLLEIEVKDCDLENLQEHIEGIFDHMVSNVSRNCKKELAMLGVEKGWLEIFRPPYKVITYEEAIKQLGLNWGDDLKSEHEKELVKRNNNKPLFVTHYPEEIKFFNMRTNRQNPRVVNSMDLLLPYAGEAVGAAEREEDYGRLIERLKKSKMLELMIEVMKEEDFYKNMEKEKIGELALESFKWYLDLVKRYPIKHAGCGIGKNRVVQAFLASNDIRACAAYPLNKETLM
ncbi:MAG: amino acid--tRNA ligase-related protein [Candidatus Pacearchaeota archaeon]